MKYVAALNFLDKLYYIRINDDGSCDECYSPIVATKFKTAEEAVDWVKENTTFGDYAKSVLFSTAEKNFNDWVNNGMIRRSFPALNKNVSRKYDKDKDTNLDVLNWWFDNEEVRYEDYETWPKLYSIFDHVWDVQKFTDGSKSFSIYTNRNGKFTNFKKELDLILDKVTPNEKEEKVLSIFDYHCGEGGNFAYLVQSKDGKWSVRTRYYDEIKNETLKECFEFMKKNRYYE